ncbi:MAG TPA: FAD-dependent thymidylate synthase [Thermoanaerobaculia bacterium]|nr:FAD-dependent thymidylate synthase [Thermoanaerobaculia bacterium]
MLRTPEFLSPEPEVHLVNHFHRSFDNAVATARTCYSARGIVTPEQVGGTDEPAARLVELAAKRDRLARDLYQAGHHTTFQHGHFQFTLDRVSRHFLWSFLHSHPFYNSEQVSQRYVTVKDGTYAVPPLAGEALAVYRRTADALAADYRELTTALEPIAADAFFERFPARRHDPERWRREIRKKAQEVARYVLPVATFAYLYHTVSAVTLFRYWRLAEQFDAPAEQRLVIGKMVAAVLAVEPAYREVLEEPIPLEETVEAQAFQRLGRDRGADPAFAARFDAALGERTSALVDWKIANEETVAESVREVLGASPAELDDDAALALVLDPAENRYFGESLNLSTLSKLTRCLSHAHYTFRKKLSHTADSQDQRHRMTPASRPILAAQVDGQPDVVEPALLARDETVRRRFHDACARAWEGMARLRTLGVDRETAQYLLPNAVAVRFTESSDLLHLHHKLTMRLCYNAQEEIWRASVDEARQVRERNPRLGRWLLPPCTQRHRAGTKPACPEGSRYCGVPVWRYDVAEYERVL